MIHCPICHKSLSPFDRSPYAPICSDVCRREAMRRAGHPVDEPPAPEQGGGAAQPQFDQLRATHLFCPTCRRSMPTRERLLLMLPSGNMYGYSCAQCGTDVGTKTDNG